MLSKTDLLIHCVIELCAFQQKLMGHRHTFIILVGHEQKKVEKPWIKR